jgi:hypothetical protein
VAERDGGPAFPRVGEGFGNPRYDAPGMTLRDWFAGQAMAAALGAFLSDPKGQPDARNKDIIAASSYAIADAMLAAREADHG